MHGKTGFNSKTAPGLDAPRELERLTEAGFRQFKDQEWL